MRTIDTYTCANCGRTFDADRPAVTCGTRCRTQRSRNKIASDAVRAVARGLVARIDTGEATASIVADLRRMVAFAPVAAARPRNAA